MTTRAADRLIRAAGAACLVAALMVATFARPSPWPTLTDQTPEPVGICHRSPFTGSTHWERFGAASWASHRSHLTDWTATEDDCR